MIYYIFPILLHIVNVSVSVNIQQAKTYNKHLPVLKTAVEGSMYVVYKNCQYIVIGNV